MPLEESFALAVPERAMPQSEMVPQVSLLAALRALRKPVEQRPSPEQVLAPVPLLPSLHRQSPPRLFESAQSALR